MKFTVTLCSFLVWTTLIGANPVWGQPFAIVKSTSFLVPLNDDAILYRDGETVVTRQPEASSADFEDLYIVNVGLRFAIPESIEATGELLDFVPGQFAMMRLTPPEAAKVAADLHREGAACGVLIKLTGVPLVQTSAPTPKPLILLDHAMERISMLAGMVSPEQIKTTVESLAAMPTRFHKSATGQRVADFLAAQYQKLAKNRRDVSIKIYDHGNATPQPSLVVRIEGSENPDEIIVLGSHLDSVNWRGDGGGNAPGADDNASGTATNMEIFRVLMANDIKLRRTLEIHAYAAEEVGLIGSQDMAQDYRNAAKNVVAMVQHDMTLWKEAGSPDKIWFVTNNTDSVFNKLLGRLVDLYVGMPWEERSLSGGSSDHASWRRAGFATAFPFENPSNHNHSIHSASDNLQTASAFNLAAGFAKLGLSYVVHFGGLSESFLHKS